MASNGETAVKIVGAFVALVLVLVFVVPVIDEEVEPQLEGKWKESYENTKSMVIFAVVVCITGLLAIAIIIYMGKK